jgi:NADPH:quinone reductase-like Zn-dependent oxidoreductase
MNSCLCSNRARVFFPCFARGTQAGRPQSSMMKLDWILFLLLLLTGSDEKLKKCLELGADVAINYKTEDFVARVKEETGGKGVDVILDVVGAPYLNKNLEALALDGRIFIIGLQGGANGEVNLGLLMAKRATIAGAGLRSRPTKDKAAIVQEVVKNVWPEIEAGKVKVIVEDVLPLEKADDAHRVLERGTHFGKVILTT